jgi:hypothetical protein
MEGIVIAGILVFGAIAVALFVKVRSGGWISIP